MLCHVQFISRDVRSSGNENIWKTTTRSTFSSTPPFNCSQDENSNNLENCKFEKGWINFLLFLFKDHRILFIFNNSAAVAAGDLVLFERNSGAVFS